MQQKTLYKQQRRYKYLAYLVVRDSLAFKFGIPTFLEESNLETIHCNALKEKLTSLSAAKQAELTDSEIAKCSKVVTRALNKRVNQLKEDLEHIDQVLFTDNIWLQLLDLDSSFFKTYLSKLSPEVKNELAIVPKWGTRDHSLGRSYINDDFAGGF